MGDMLACLRGWHPGLAKAELAALMPDARLEMERSARWVRVHGGSDVRRSEALRIASGLQCFLLDAVVSTTDDGSPEAWLESMAAYVDAYPVEGTVAVRAWKQGSKIPGWSTSELSRQLGGVLFERGYSVDLEAPDHVLALVADGPTASLACGWMEGDGQAAFSNGERRAGERPFFKPVSLDPMLARLAVNMAAGPLERGPVVDPMTGTGGFLIEASLSGRNAIGIDIHSEMVQGANANLLWAHGGNDPEHAAVKRGDATRLPDVLPGEWSGKVAGFVLDPPYGRNSHGSMANDPLLEASFAVLAQWPIPRQVLSSFSPFIRWPSTRQTVCLLTTPLRCSTVNGRTCNGWWTSCGWAPQSVHVERVHRSLSRLILHARCAPQD